MKIYLIRHGETPWNRESRIQGREDIPLSSEGLEQARMCAGVFSRVNVTAVLTSPLSRAVETAKLIAQAASAPIFTEPDLTERDFGSVSGMKVDIFDPERYGSDLEPLDDVAERMERAILNFAAGRAGDFAAVSHGGAINALLRRLSRGQVGSGKTRLKNAGVSVLICEGGELRIEAVNLDAPEILSLCGGAE